MEQHTAANAIAAHKRALAALRCLRRTNLIPIRTGPKPFWTPAGEGGVERFGWITISKLTCRNLAQTVGSGSSREVEITAAGRACLEEIERRKLA